MVACCRSQSLLVSRGPYLFALAPDRSLVLVVCNTRTSYPENALPVHLLRQVPKTAILLERCHQNGLWDRLVFEVVFELVLKLILSWF